MSWHISEAMMRHCESLRCSPGRAGGFSDLPYSDGKLYAQWRSTPFAQDDLCSGKMKDTFHRSPYGMMFVPLTDAPGVPISGCFKHSDTALRHKELCSIVEGYLAKHGFHPEWIIVGREFFRAMCNRCSHDDILKLTEGGAIVDWSTSVGEGCYSVF